MNTQESSLPPSPGTREYAETEYQRGLKLARGESGSRQIGPAAEAFRNAAEAGHPMAQCNLGFLHTVGDGVPEDRAEAARWFQAAADQGLPQAQFNLARMLGEGDGIPKDETKALELYRQAALQGHTDSLYNLGLFYYGGEYGLKQDHKAAATLFENGANAGHTKCQYSLGLCYNLGHGVEHSPEKAVHWYGKAAADGDVNATFNLGLHHYYGEGGLEANPEKARELFLAAAAKGHPKAQAAADSIPPARPPA